MQRAEGEACALEVVDGSSLEIGFLTLILTLDVTLLLPLYLTWTLNPTFNLLGPLK